MRHTDCERARQWASAELDGELSELEHASLAAHVAGCASCGAFQASIVGLTTQLRAAQLEPFERIIELGRRHRPAFRLAPAAAVLAVAAVGLGSVLASSVLRNVPGGIPGARPSTQIDSPTNRLRQVGVERLLPAIADPQRLRGGVVG